MKMNKSFLIAFIAFAAIAIWFLVNNWNEGPPAEGKTQAEFQAENLQKMPTVQVKSVSAQAHENVLLLYGQTEASREVTVRAETAGSVVSAPAAEGRVVRKGDLLCQQDVDARQALVDQAAANMRSIENDLRSARTLAEKGFQSNTRVIAFEAQLDGAKAALKQAQIELDNVNIRAPFTGIWETQIAEVGDYLAPGQSCGLLVDLSPLTVVIQLTETQVALVKSGDMADITLATGETVTGKINFIQAKADIMTRTFRTEILVPNTDYSLKAGVTATVRISSGETLAQRIPSNILTLNDNGDVGVRYLDSGNIVRFAQVNIIDEEAGGAWVTGLPERTRIIVEGQDFVAVGMEVIPNSTPAITAAQ
jgi:multidrug efflux system membrane fusion protein